MWLITDRTVPVVKITVERDEAGDVALKANGFVVLWVMGCFNGIRLNGCDPKELGFTYLTPLAFWHRLCIGNHNTHA